MSQPGSLRRFRPSVESLEDRCVPASIAGPSSFSVLVAKNAPTAILVGMLKPSSPEVIVMNSSGLAKGGPQPEPPTKVASALSGWAAITPVPQPPTILDQASIAKVETSPLIAYSLLLR